MVSRSTIPHNNARMSRFPNPLPHESVDVLRHCSMICWFECSETKSTVRFCHCSGALTWQPLMGIHLLAHDRSKPMINRDAAMILFRAVNISKHLPKLAASSRSRTDRHVSQSSNLGMQTATHRVPTTWLSTTWTHTPRLCSVAMSLAYPDRSFHSQFWN